MDSKKMRKLMANWINNVRPGKLSTQKKVKKFTLMQRLAPLRGVWLELYLYWATSSHRANFSRLACVKEFRKVMSLFFFKLGIGIKLKGRSSFWWKFLESLRGKSFTRSNITKNVQRERRFIVYTTWFNFIQRLNKIKQMFNLSLPTQFKTFSLKLMCQFVSICLSLRC